MRTSQNSQVLLQGDCLEVMSTIQDDSIDMVLADLPYGCTQNGWDTEITLEPLWQHLRRICTKHAAILLFASDRYSAKLIASNERDFRYNLIWYKTQPTGFLNARRMPLRAHENICVFYQRLPVYNPQMASGSRKVSLARHQQKRQSSNYGAYASSSYDSTERFPTSVLTFPSDKQKSALHPTQKPVDLCSYLIKTYTNSGDTVLDFCMGSGTTGISCRSTKRNFVGIEKDMHYFDIAARRLKEKEQFRDE